MPLQTGLVFFPAFDWRITPTHPEREERLLFTLDQLNEEGIFDLPEILEIRPRFAQLEDIARTHASFPSLEANVTEGNLAAAGSALAIAEKFFNKEIKNGFALVRPPGHHAMHVVHGNRGFCNINNEAILVDYIRKNYGVKKVAIIDTDVHHGDGTQDVFYHDPNLLFISIHQDGRTLYPGTGFINECGGPKALGYTLNFPLPPETTDEGFLYVMEKAIMPIIQDFKPEIIINSAGQDNHFSDPLARMQMTARGYAKLNQILAPDIAVLEGGYSVEGALPYVNMAIILAMAGLDYSKVIEPELNITSMTPAIKKEIKYICEANLKNWNAKHLIKSREYQKEGNWYVRTRGIYYDTEGIREQQKEMLSVCNNCSGLKVTNSKAQGTNRLKTLIVTLPLDACEACIDAAEKLYLENKISEFDVLYLQNKVHDKYLYYHVHEKREEVAT